MGTTTGAAAKRRPPRRRKAAADDTTTMPREEAARIAATKPYWDAAVGPEDAAFWPTFHWTRGLDPLSRVVWCCFCAYVALGDDDPPGALMALRMACTGLEEEWPGVAEDEVCAACDALGDAALVLEGGDADAAVLALEPFVRARSGIIGCFLEAPGWERRMEERRARPKAAERAYTLIDGEARNREHPDTFEVPCRHVKDAVGPGWAVKVGSEYPAPGCECGGCEPGGERFWVVVEARADDGGLRGRVDNHLYGRGEHGLDHGDEVAFEPRHILDVDPPPTRPDGATVH